MNFNDLKPKHIFMMWPAYFIIAIIIDYFATSRYGSLSGGLLVVYWIMMSMFYISLFIANFSAYKKDKSTFNLIFVLATALLLGNYIIRFVWALFT